MSSTVGKVIGGTSEGELLIHVVDSRLDDNLYPMGLIRIGNDQDHYLIPNDWIGAKLFSKGFTSYKLISTKSDISTSSALKRAAVGGVLVGPIGVTAGLTARKEQKYTIQINWYSGGSSIIELNDEGYNTFISMASKYSAPDQSSAQFIDNRRIAQNKSISSNASVEEVEKFETHEGNDNNLVERGNMSLEDGAFEEANSFFNRALDINPKNAEAYLGIFMAEIKAKNQSEAKKTFVNPENNYQDERHYKRAKQFASGSLAQTFMDWENEREAQFHENERIKNKDSIAQHIDSVDRITASLKNELEKGITDEEKIKANKLKEKYEEDKDAYDTYIRETSESLKELNLQDDQLTEQLLDIDERINKLGGIFQRNTKKKLSLQFEQLKEKYSTVEDKINEINEKERTLDHKQRTSYENCINFIINTIKERKKVKDELSDKISQIYSDAGLMYINYSNECLFGHYGHEDNVEPIRWIILETDSENHKCLLLSKYAIDTHVYSDTAEAHCGHSWHDSTLRRWLNNDFYNNAFSEEEKKRIVTSQIEDTCEEGLCIWDKDHKATSLGNIKDKVFLLSINEVSKYKMPFEDRVQKAYLELLENNKLCLDGLDTWNYFNELSEHQSFYRLDAEKNIDFCLLMNEKTKNTYKGRIWWLRTSNFAGKRAWCLGDDEEKNVYAVNKKGIGVRPAMWVYLD